MTESGFTCWVAGVGAGAGVEVGGVSRQTRGGQVVMLAKVNGSQ